MAADPMKSRDPGWLFSELRTAMPLFSPPFAKGIFSLAIGSSLNAGFISGSPRYNDGKQTSRSPRPPLRSAKNYERSPLAMASIYPPPRDVAVALVVGARNHQQIAEDYNSLQAKIPSEFLGRT